jgi:hypothetical protein
VIDLDNKYIGHLIDGISSIITVGIAGLAVLLFFTQLAEIIPSGPAADRRETRCRIEQPPFPPPVEHHGPGTTTQAGAVRGQEHDR